MPKFIINATELQDPQVGMISMVKRGATRIPFKITKGDDSDMIDLANLGRQFYEKADPVAPVVIGAVLSKSADVTAFLADCKTAGLEFDTSSFKKADADTCITFTKTDATAEVTETLVVRVNEDIAFVVKGDVEFVKSMSGYDWESTSFAEVMSKGQFCPSVYMAQDMLSRTFSNIMEKADNPKDLAKMISAATGEFESYVVGLAKGLPASIFKADEIISKSEASRKAAKAKLDPENVEKKPLKEAVKKGDPSDEPVKETRVGQDLNDPDELAGTKDKKDQQKTLDNPAQKALDAPDTKDLKVTKNETPDFAKLITDGIAAGLKGVNEKLDAMGTRIEKAEKSVHGTVLGTDREDRDVKKSDEPAGDDWTTGAPSLLDSAFNRREALADRKH